jgi:hypothetical protein
MEGVIQDNSTVYCHFSFKRPNKGVEGYGLFAVAFYRDAEGKKVIYHVTKKMNLWQNHQFITAIQSYENALRVISELQGDMINNRIRRVILVTDNSTLAGWIMNPKKNKAYTDYMNKAVEKYRAGGPRQIMVDIELDEVREYEKSYKYCNEKNVVVTENKKVTQQDDGRNAINIETIQGGYKTISQMLKEFDNGPTVTGIKELL